MSAFGYLFCGLVIAATCAFIVWHSEREAKRAEAKRRHPGNVADEAETFLRDREPRR